MGETNNFKQLELATRRSGGNGTYLALPTETSRCRPALGMDHGDGRSGAHPHVIMLTARLPMVRDHRTY
jgi:hypothetical protein